MQAFIYSVLEAKTNLDSATLEMISAKLVEIANKTDRDETEQLMAKWFQGLC